MDQNPYESPAAIDTGVPRKTVFSRQAQYWSALIAVPISLIAAIAFGAVFVGGAPPAFDQFPIWSYPIFAILFVIFCGGIITVFGQMCAEIFR